MMVGVGGGREEVVGEEEEDVVSGQALTDSQTNTDNIGKLVASCLLLIVAIPIRCQYPCRHYPDLES